VIPWLGVRRIHKKKREAGLKMGGGFLKTCRLLRTRQLPFTPKKNRHAEQSGFRPEPRAQGGDAIGRMKPENNENACRELVSRTVFLDLR